MRITGNRMLDLASASTARAQESVSDRSDEVTSGLRVAKPSDDPVAWAQAERAKVRKALSAGTGAAVDAGRDHLEETDGALASIGEALSQVRALAVQGANDSNDAKSRAAIGAQVSSLFSIALGAANTRGTSGEFVLAGSATSTAPFDSGGAYLGDALANSIASSDRTSVVATVPGSSLTATNGVDVLPLMARVAAALSTNDTASLALQLDALDTAIHQVSGARSTTGSGLASLDAASTARSALELHLSTEISQYVEVDAVGSASALAKASHALDASRTISAHLATLLDPRR